MACILPEYHPSNYQTGFVNVDESVSDVIGALKHYMKDEWNASSEESVESDEYEQEENGNEDTDR